MNKKICMLFGAMVFFLILMICSCGRYDKDSMIIDAEVDSIGTTLTIVGEEDGLHYTTSSISLPKDISHFQFCRGNEESVYLVSISWENANKIIIYSLSLNGDVQWEYELLLNQDEGVSTGIKDIYPDDEGLWILLCSFKENPDNNSKYINSNVLYICDGQVKREIVIDSLQEAPFEWIVDSARNCFYFINLDPLLKQSSIIGVDYQDCLLFQLNNNTISYHPCFTAGGALAICNYKDGYTTIQTVDLDNQLWDAEYTIPEGVSKLFSGVDHDLYYVDADCKTLYCVDIITGEIRPVIHLLECGIDINPLDIADIGNQRFFVASNDTLMILIPTNEANNVVKELTLATFDYAIISHEVLAFNRAQSDYKIVVKDYSEYNSGNDNTGGLNQLNLDIASGDVPDIYDLTSIPITQYIRLGLLEDLYPYMDDDPGIDRTDYVESLLMAMETEGKLYVLMPHVCVMAIAVNPTRINTTETFTIDDLVCIANGRDPFGGLLQRYEFVQLFLAGYDSPFVNWADGSCHFDSEEFVAFLELSKLLPEVEPEDSSVQQSGDRLLTVEYIAGEGAIIDSSDILGCMNEDEGCAAYVGLPGKNGERYLLCPSRLSFGMSAQSKYKDGVWTFLRSYLLDDYQNTNGLPILKTSWDVLSNEYLSWIDSGGLFSRMGDDELLHITSNVYFNKLLELSGKANGIYEKNPALMEIIMNEAQGYYTGDKTAEQTSKNIQSRASIYMAEQG